MTSIPTVNLHFEDSGDWHILPEWAEYFINVGKLLGSADLSASRIVTAIVVPTRAFAAAFVSLGLVISDSASQNQTSESDHFELLFDQPPGSSVIYRERPGKTLKGVLGDPAEMSGNLFIRVQVHSRDGGSLTYLVGERQAHKVQLALHSGKLPKKQSGKNARFASQFVDSLLGEPDPVQLGLRSKLCCAIVGRKNALEHEIRRTPLSFLANGNHHAQGFLQDVLRVDRFVSEQQSHRSALVSVGTSPPTSKVVENVEIGVVFDGANGFLKWGDLWAGRHQIVILDRTDNYFEDAISAINNRFSQNRLEGESAILDYDAPPGGEVLTFREACK